MVRNIDCSIMAVTLLCTVLLLNVVLSAAGGAEIKNCKPAAIIKQARRVMYFQQQGDATLPCIAKGDPSLRYVWLKNGVELDITAPENRERMTLHPGVGTLELLPTIASDEGVYQCQVQNPCGTSLSSKTSLLNAYIEPFPVEQPKKVKAIWGMPLKMQCSPPRSVPEASVTWVFKYDDEDEDLAFYEVPEEEDSELTLVPMGRRITMDYEGNLYFVAVEQEDAQESVRYVCMASNKILRSINQGDDKIIELFGSAQASSPTELQWHSAEEVLVLEGAKARFKCIFSGNPYPYVQWHRTSGGEKDGDRMQQSADQHEFTIVDVKAEDAGQYECSGENALIPNPIKKSFILKVESHPKWTTRPEDMVVSVDDSVTMMCNVDAKPKARIEWFINGVPIDQAPPSPNRHVRGNALLFTNLTLDDSQVIQCNASNTHGYLWIDAYLQVEAMEPAIVNKPIEQKVAKGRDVIIPCGVEGKPMPQVMWYKGSQKLVGSRYVILPSGDLKITSVDRRDTDNYMCIAKNRFGEATAQGALIVRERTRIVTPPDSDMVNSGESVIFICRAVTDPEEQRRLRYTWLKNDVEVDARDPRVEISEGELKISNTNSGDTGQYTCAATNDLDSDQAVAELEVRAPPDPPTSMEVVSCGALRVELQWEFEDSQSNFSPLLEFVVEYSTMYEQNLWSEAGREPPYSRQMSFQMSPWAEYRFRVRARNQMGLGEPSQQTDRSCKTASALPFRNPRNVRTVVNKTDWLVIEWEPMSKIDHNAVGFHYLVTWQADGQDEMRSARIDDWRQGSLEVPDAGIFKPYNVKVRAVNSLGMSRMEPFTVRGHSGEAAPEIVVENFELDPDEPMTSSSASFRWDAVDPESPNMNGQFQGYKIRYWKRNQKEDTMHQELIYVPNSRGRQSRSTNSGEKIRGRVSQLPSYSQVEADVVVVNTFFTSPGSNVVFFTTPEGVPSRVEYLQAMFRGSSHFLMEWGPPIERNGILTGYELGYQKVDGLMIGPRKVYKDDILPSQHRASLRGLEPDTLYSVYIAAKTASGVGKRYFVDLRTADENSDLVEPKIESVSAGEHEANVTFSLTEAENGGRTGSVYYLEYRKFGEHGWDRYEEGATDHFWLTLADLEPATTYEVRVVSVPKTAAKSSMEFKPSQETRFDTTGIGAKSSGFLSAAWFIGMMVAIAILLLVLIIVCIAKRNRGKEYKFPPESDVMEKTPALFTEPPKGTNNGIGRGSLEPHEAEKIPLGEETESLAEYGDVDPCRFNEDGSFIGQYGEANQPPGPPPPPLTYGGGNQPTGPPPPFSNVM